MPTSFAVTTRTTASVEDLFDASLSIDHHLDSMRSSGERAVAGVTSGTIGLGESVTWRARHFGIRFTMTSRITALDRPHRFVDEQTRGPFRSFRHEHVFRSEGTRTVMVDTLTVESPTLGVPAFGTLVERLILVPYLRRLIRQRNAHLVAAVAPTPPAASSS
ncbi:MAG: SRPBCC family protein [Microbacterium sp.]|uniref:SRPBCC family protein n=1 Tax=Microbacterium sp. TaxID=51671 RepID=UPI0027277A20|nr:SRPBCC family protein [Microbacterium sp.]MDO8383037.1 SRPBCC family protein [Microbacterium sp.]